MQVVGVIPARLQSTRLPRKLLLDDTGKPLIQYVWEAATRTATLDDVIVAADCEEICETVRCFGGRAELTGAHSCGTDRVAEVVRRCCPNADVIVNLQGDEPELEPADVDRLVESMRRHADDEMATLATPIRDADTLRDPGCVKVVTAGDGRALYFSRTAIPFTRDLEPAAFLEDRAKPQAADEIRCPSPWLLHVGLYAYRREFLLHLTALPPSRLEQLETLEQLRALEAGATVRVETVARAGIGIDTPNDYARFVERQRGADPGRLPKSA
ncbi:MAG: 3-deoxy-manno-octulosonate cytidylyltransferase [Planctomycetaceae bacterium]